MKWRFFEKNHVNTSPNNSIEMPLLVLLMLLALLVLPGAAEASEGLSSACSASSTSRSMAAFSGYSPTYITSVINFQDRSAIS